MSILDQLWNGEIRVFERKILKSPEYRQVLRRAGKLEEQLLQVIGEENRKLLDDFESADAEAQGMMEQEAFVIGFSLGVQILLEAMEKRSFGRES